MSALLKELQGKTKEINEIKANLVAELRPKFQGVFMPIFDKWHQLEAIKWTQYAPYFNDGEACEFRVRDLHFCVSGVNDSEESHYEWQDGEIRSWVLDPSTDEKASQWQFDAHEKYLCSFGSQESLKSYNDDVISLIKEFRDIPEDVMKDMFGDHAIILVTRNGLETEEYDHD